MSHKSHRSHPRRRPKTHRDDQGEFRWETYFVRGKQKRRKVRMLDGKDFDEDAFIRANADDIWLLQQGEYEILHEREMKRNQENQEPPEDEDEIPF